MDIPEVMVYAEWSTSFVHFFFFNDTATTEIYTLSLHDALPISSHVLPTGGTARFTSGLSANDFMRRSSVISYAPKGLARVADDVRLLANKEVLTAHAASVDIRLSDNLYTEEKPLGASGKSTHS